MEKKEELIKKYGYWGEHPDYPYREWAAYVSEDYTRLGYWEWVIERENGGMVYLYKAERKTK